MHTKNNKTLQFGAHMMKKRTRIYHLEKKKCTTRIVRRKRKARISDRTKKMIVNSRSNIKKALQYIVKTLKLLQSNF